MVRLVDAAHHVHAWCVLFHAFLRGGCTSGIGVQAAAKGSPLGYPAGSDALQQFTLNSDMVFKEQCPEPCTLAPAQTNNVWLLAQGCSA